MSNQSKKTAQPKKKTPASKTSSTPPESPDQASEVLAALASQLKPLLDFHQKVDGAAADDLRIYWDVRLVRGEDEPFAHTKGTSSLPGCLSKKMKANAPAQIQQEVVDKIATPLTAVFQDEAEEQNADQMERLGKTSMHHPATDEDVSVGGGDEVLAHANEGAPPPLPEPKESPEDLEFSERLEEEKERRGENG